MEGSSTSTLKRVRKKKRQTSEDECERRDYV